MVTVVPADYPAAVNTPFESTARFVGRYVIAAWTIPIGVALGIGGLAQNWSRQLTGRPRRSAAAPVGRPEGSGLRDRRSD